MIEHIPCRPTHGQRFGVVLDSGFPVAAEAAAKEAEYLVKWTGKAHAHNEWVPESTLAKLAKRKLANFKRRHGNVPCCLAEDAW